MNEEYEDRAHVCPHPMLEMNMPSRPRAMHENSVTKPSEVNVTRILPQPTPQSGSALSSLGMPWEKKSMLETTMPNSVTKPSAKNVTRMWLMMINRKGTTALDYKIQGC